MQIGLIPIEILKILSFLRLEHLVTEMSSLSSHEDIPETDSQIKPEIERVRQQFKFKN